MAQRSDVDATAAIRALGYLAGGGGGCNNQLAVVEDLFLSGTVYRMRGELASRRQPDDVTAAIGEFLAAVAGCPASHVRLLDASLLPLLPVWMAPQAPPPPQGGGSTGAAGAGSSAGGSAAAASVTAFGGGFVEAAYFLSTSEVAAASMRTEAYLEGLLRAISAAGAAPNVRRAALLALCNLFGWDSGNKRAEEAMRTHQATAMLAAMLAAALGPEDTGAASRASGSNSAGPRRSLAGQGAASRRMRTSDGGGGPPLPRGGGGSRAANSGATAAAAAAALGALQQRASETSGGAQSAPGEGAGTNGGLANGKGLPSAGSLTAPGGSGGAVSLRVSGSGDGTVHDYNAIPLETVLHSIKCVACSPSCGRRMAATGTPSYVIPRLLDVIVSSQQHYAAGAISRAAWLARIASATQTLMRLASCGEVLPALRAAGAISVLRVLALEAEDTRVTEPARAALLYIGDGGHVGCTSRATVAAFRSLYGDGDVALAGLEPEFDGRYDVFISHRRADAHQFAIYSLYPALLMQGVPTYVDLHNRTLSGDWAHMITCCRNLVVVLSESLLGSADHLREMEFAVGAGVHVVLVVPEGARWPDVQGNKTFDSPPQPLLDTLPDRLRGVFSDKPLVYSASKHGEFTQQLMAKLRLPPSLTDASDGESLSPRRLPRPDAGVSDGEGIMAVAPARGHRSRRNPSEAGGRRGARGAGGAWGPHGDDGGHRVSFTAEGELPMQAYPQRTRQQSLQGTLEEDPIREDNDPSPEPTEQPPLPWPWSRLFDGNGEVEDEDLQRYPRALSVGPGGGAAAAAAGGSGLQESVSGSAVRMSSSSASPSYMGGGGSGILASHASRRATARQRSSLNRHAALQLQQQQQFMLMQQQWMTEYQQHLQGRGQAQEDGEAPPQAEAEAGPADAAGPGVGATAGVADGATVAMSQLLALQLEMVRYEMRQAVQASHEMISHKIDRLRSDVTEQVVQLRFDLAGKIEAVQDALTKLASGKTGGGAAAATAASGAGAGSPTAANGATAAVSPAAQQQLAQALSTTLAASLQDAVNRAVVQLQASVVQQAAPSTPNAHKGAAGGHQSAVVMLAQAAAAQERHSPHPPHTQAHGRSSVMMAAPPLGIELSPVARAGAAAWSGESGVVPSTVVTPPAATASAAGGGGGGGGHVPSSKAVGARNSHAAHANGTLPGGGRSSIAAANGNAAAAGGAGGAGPAGGRPSALAMFDGGGLDDDPGGGRVASPSTSLMASLNSPAMAQAVLLGRTRQYMQGGGGAGTATGMQRGGSGTAPGAAAANGGKAPGGNTLPPLTGQLTGGGGSGTLSPPPTGKMAERGDTQSLRKSQQQAPGGR